MPVSHGDGCCDQHGAHIDRASVASMHALQGLYAGDEVVQIYVAAPQTHGYIVPIRMLEASAAML